MYKLLDVPAQPRSQEREALGTWLDTCPDCQARRVTP